MLPVRCAECWNHSWPLGLSAYSLALRLGAWRGHSAVWRSTWLAGSHSLPHTHLCPGARDMKPHWREGVSGYELDSAGQHRSFWRTPVYSVSLNTDSNEQWLFVSSVISATDIKLHSRFMCSIRNGILILYECHRSSLGTGRTLPHVRILFEEE